MRGLREFKPAMFESRTARAQWRLEAANIANASSYNITNDVELFILLRDYGLIIRPNRNRSTAPEQRGISPSQIIRGDSLLMPRNQTGSQGCPKAKKRHNMSKERGAGVGDIPDRHLAATGGYYKAPMAYRRSVRNLSKRERRTPTGW